MTFLQAMDQFSDAHEAADIAHEAWKAARDRGDQVGMALYSAMADDALAVMHAAEQAMAA